MKDLKSLNRFFVKYRGRLLAGIVFVALANLLNIFPAQLTRDAIDFVLRNKKSFDALSNDVNHQQLFYNSVIKNIAWLGFLILLSVFARGVFLFLMRQTIIVMSRHIEYDQKNEIYNHYQQLDMSFYARNNTGDLMNRISEDVSRVRMYAGPAIMYTINMAVMVAMVVWAMMRISPTLCLYVLMPLPVMVLLIYFIQNNINKKGELVQQKLSTLSSKVQETFSGIRIVKSFSKEKLFHNLFKSDAEDYKFHSLALARLTAMFFPSIMLLIGISTINTIYFGGKMVNEHAITYGNIAEFVIYVNMITWPIGSLGWVITLIQRADASQKRINEFLFTQPKIISKLNAVKKNIQGSLHFNDVSFQYENANAFALSGINFSIKQGEVVAFIGTTGSGKTTLANLLLRMADPVKGNIEIDGTDLRDYDLASLRNQIGYVPQDVVLFSDTIYNNIIFGIKNKNGEITNHFPAEEMAKRVMVHDDISAFKNGYQTVVGERGLTLSGGQKQRISIARALLKNPPLLIFDDCFSAVDTHTEEKILSNLFNQSQKQTTLILGHRITTTKYASRILVFDDGKVIEEGDHDSLIAAKGFYANMYQAQLAEIKSVAVA